MSVLIKKSNQGRAEPAFLLLSFLIKWVVLTSFAATASNSATFYGSLGRRQVDCRICLPFTDEQNKKDRTRHTFYIYLSKTTLQPIGFKSFTMI